MDHPKNARTLLAVLLGASLSACYESAAPLAERGTTPLDARLAGQWRCVAAEADEPTLFTMSAVSPTELDVVMGGPDERPSRLHAYSARGGAALANVQEIEDDGTPGKWILARYTLHRPTVLEIEVASERALKGPDEGAAPRERARRHLAAGDLFDQYCVCVRVKAKDESASALAK